MDMRPGAGRAMDMLLKQQLCGPLSLDPLPCANIRVALSF